MLPKGYVSSSTCHRRFQEWRESGIFYTLWTILLQKYDKKIGIGGAMTGHNPTDRGKLGTKRHIVTDKNGIPLSIVITSANTHDVTVAINTVDNMVIKRQSSSTDRNKKKKQNLCLDKAYHSKDVEQEIIKRGYIPHIRYRREEEEKLFHRKHPVRR
jgi:putative transposase